jgi:hypothetical protein
MATAIGTGVRQQIRSLALAAVLAFAAASVPMMQAHAEPVGPTDPGVRCAARVGPGQYEFYLPGEKATDVNGNKWVCGPDGQWFRDYSALQIPSRWSNPRAPTTNIVVR